MSRKYPYSICRAVLLRRCKSPEATCVGEPFFPHSCSNETVQTQTGQLLLPYINKVELLCVTSELMEAHVCTLLLLAEARGAGSPESRWSGQISEHPLTVMAQRCEKRERQRGWCLMRRANQSSFKDDQEDVMDPSFPSTLQLWKYELSLSCRVAACDEK